VQGLIYVDDVLYESTGRYGASSLRKMDLVSGEVLQIIWLPQELYGEGMTILGDKVFQITWKNRVGLVYDKESFELLPTDTTINDLDPLTLFVYDYDKESFELLPTATTIVQTLNGYELVYDKGSFELLDTFSYLTEGWGITHDGSRLIMSDGTATLYFWDPETLTEIGRIEVFDDHGPVAMLNELEYIKGEIYANVWQTNRIARINPDSGRVIGWIVLDGLLSETDRQQPVDVLNGIAYDALKDRLFVTGKRWPKLFEIKLK
jgi:glutamine cyclotransferase